MAGFHGLSKPELQARLQELRAGGAGGPDKTQRLLQDLQIHQIELEMQNRELCEAQALLEQSRDRYADLYDFAPVGYMSLNAKGHILEMNLTGAALLGMERAQIIDYPFSTFIARRHGEFFQHLKHALDPAQRGAMTSVELTIKTRAGELRDLRLESVTAEREGAPVCRCALIDITERLRAEEALRRAHDELEDKVRARTADLAAANADLRDSRSHLQAILDGSPNCIAVKGLQRRYTLINRACTELFCRRTDDVLGKTDYELFENARADALRACEQQVVDSGASVSFDERFVTPDGERNFISWCFPLRESGGAVSALCLIRTDITERIQAERKLLQAAAVFDNTDQGIVVCDPDGVIIAVNRAFTDITGYSGEEIQGLPLRRLHSDPYDEAAQRDLLSALADAGRWQGEAWYRSKDGDVFPVWKSVSTVRDERNAVVNHVIVFSDISVIKETERNLVYLAEHDPLTGVGNRLLFDSRLEIALETARRHGRRAALLFVDLDRFKVVNDTLGHQAGDAVLRAAVTRLTGCVRAEDMLARLGGDEFALLLTEIRLPQDAARVAQHVIDNLIQPFMVDDHELSIGGSVGIAIYPDDATTGLDLKKAADTALYLAKERGRGNYQFYSADLTDKAFRLFSLAQELRHALSTQQLRLVYQPIIAVDSGQVVGVEALLRWLHPKLGLLGPGDFLAVAKDAGLADAIDEWVLHTATRQARAWRADALPPFRLAVNLIADGIGRNDGTLSRVKRALDVSGFEPHLLEIEISEGSLQTSVESIRGISALKSLGVTLAVDDFGTAYSCLALLVSLPIDALKIDRSFIEGIPGPSQETLSSLIIDMGRKLNLRVVAEGVTTDVQRRFLERTGCHEMQGFLFGVPQAADEIARSFKN